MISVCIPVYNYDIRELVSELYIQCVNEKIKFEIICIDDYSTNTEIKLINKQFFLNLKNDYFIYEELSVNKGRSAIRNYFLNFVNYEYCWFLDCDGKVAENKNLLTTFLKNLDKNFVVSGARIYQTEIPENKLLRLHWTWASKRELLDPVKRMKNPVQNFLSNNFIVHKSILLKIPFNEQLDGYGYEDTFWAAQVVNSGFKIKHINNPVLHDGLEINVVFLNKIIESIKNLIKLKIICDFQGINFPVKSNLTMAANFLNNTIIKHVANFLFKKKINKWKSILLGEHFNLLIFDLYRLAYYFETIKK
jgi:hypothetical protein